MSNRGDLSPLWTKIVAVHLSLKQLIIKGEEFDKELETYVQPTLEQRSALDHICRAQAASLGLKDVDDPDTYASQQLDKALGHLYRGYFDAADWFSISIRDRISETLPPILTTVFRQLFQIISANYTKI